MRNINRIRPLYEKVIQAHEQFPDLRFFQFYDNFTTWIHRNKGIDDYFIEDNKVEELLDEFIESLKREK